MSIAQRQWFVVAHDAPLGAPRSAPWLRIMGVKCKYKYLKSKSELQIDGVGKMRGRTFHAFAWYSPISKASKASYRASTAHLPFASDKNM